MHTINLEPFKYGGTNITAVRLINPEDPEVQETVKWWVESETLRNYIASNDRTVELTAKTLRV